MFMLKACVSIFIKIQNVLGKDDNQQANLEGDKRLILLLVFLVRKAGVCSVTSLK